MLLMKTRQLVTINSRVTSYLINPSSDVASAAAKVRNKYDGDIGILNLISYERIVSFGC